MKLSLLVLFLISVFFTTSCSQSNNFITEFVNYPNPFEASSDFTTYQVSIAPDSVAIIKAQLKIYSMNGDLLADIDIPIDVELNSITTKWHGSDKNGNTLPSAVYYAEIYIENSDGNIAKATTKTLIK